MKEHCVVFFCRCILFSCTETAVKKTRNAFELSSGNVVFGLSVHF